MHIPFDDNSTRNIALGGENHVRNFHNSLAASGTETNDRLRVVDICKRRASTHYDGPRFTDDLSSSGDCDGRSDEVSAMVEEDDFASSELCSLRISVSARTKE